MSDDVTPDLVEISSLIEIPAPGAFRFGGRTTAVEDIAFAERALANALYSYHYQRPSGPRMSVRDDDASRALVARYTIANGGRGTFEPGWQLVRIESDGRYVVTKHGVDFWVTSAHVSVQATSASPHPFVRVAVPNELRGLLPGYYMFVGDAPSGAEPSARSLTRLYFHVTEPAAYMFVASISTLLNAENIPFRAKVLNQSGQFFRADSAVLYLERTCLERALPSLRVVHKTLKAALREATPMFTLKLARGLGIADDPGPANDSFGQNRCLLVARGLLASFIEQPPSPAERLAGVIRAFGEAGVSVDQPHLHSSLAEPYPVGFTSRGFA